MTSSPKKLLAIDTSTLVASVAVCIDGAVASAAEAQVTTHSEGLLGLIDSVVRQAGLEPFDLDGVACGSGPGSFTGLRIGMATAKGLAYAVGCPLWQASSLAVLAASVPDARVLAVLDARKREIYAGLFQVSGHRSVLLGEEAVMPPDQLVGFIGGADPNLVVTGDGRARYPAECALAGPTASGGRDTPDAGDLARVVLAGGGHESPLLTAAPTYIRKSEAELRLNERKR